VHDPGAWVTVKLWPAIVTVAIRGAAVLLAAIVIVTVPLPVPLDPALTRIHCAPLAALQTQVSPVVTVALVISPAAGDDLAVGPSVKAHAPVPTCVTVNVRPAIVTAAER
jgi:hypothetical protein